ncbi:MAG: glycosyltransferase [Actinomycetes bacterium]
MRPSLTIAIPTFNRSESVVSAVNDALGVVSTQAISLLVIDDGSSDDTAAGLAPFVDLGARVLTNAQNRGYAETFCRIIREAETEWVLVSADDDRFDFSKLGELEQWLVQRQPHFVSTQWHHPEGYLFRGRKTTGPIKVRDLRASSSHAPGLIYQVSAARAALPLLERHLAEGSAAAHAYPQVFVAAQLFTDSRAMWWSGSIVNGGADLPSGVRDGSERHYADPQSRLSQAIDFDRAFRQLAQQDPSRAGRRRARTWQREHELFIYPAVQAAVLSSNSTVDTTEFDHAMGRFVRRARWHRGVRAVPGVTGLLSWLRRIAARNRH